MQNDAIQLTGIAEVRGNNMKNSGIYKDSFSFLNGNHLPIYIVFDTAGKHIDKFHFIMPLQRRWKNRIFLNIIFPEKCRKFGIVIKNFFLPATARIHDSCFWIPFGWCMLDNCETPNHLICVVQMQVYQRRTFPL